MMDKEHKYVVVKFIKFIKDDLSLSKPFKVIFATEQDDKLKTYAYYDPNSNIVKVLYKNRGLADVLRSIAHELIHHQQMEKGLLDKPVQDIGGNIEDEANSLAGAMVKKFGYANPDLAIYSKNL